MSMNAFILAGGKSVRMGRDKTSLDWHRRSLLDHMVNLLESVTDCVRIVGRGALPDRIPGLGPVGGIATALEISESDANLVVAVDLPLLTPDFLKQFRQRFENSEAAILACKIGETYPLCLGLRRAVLPQLQARLTRGDLSVHGFIEACPAEILHDGFDPSIFKNINTYEDYCSGGL